MPYTREELENQDPGPLLDPSGRPDEDEDDALEGIYDPNAPDEDDDDGEYPLPS